MGMGKEQKRLVLVATSAVLLLLLLTCLYADCGISHNVLAVVFSSGGFTGNLFHEINELIIPLFITTRHFRSDLKFVITDYKPWWVSKYSKILTHLSHYEVINPSANGSVVHCFPGAVIGLKYHDKLALNTTDIPGGYAMFDFTHFLRESYNLNKFSELVNSCSVLVGAHGAGLTNQLFLPARAVLVQVVPLGLDWASTNYYGAPARGIGVQYLEYKIEPEESSLMQTYGKDHPVITEPATVFSKGYYAVRAVYVDGQNLTINVKRFKETIVHAKELIGQSIPLN